MSGKRSIERARARIEEIRRRIAALDLVVGGTLVRRTKVCGKPGCRCATDPAARHGPYWEWGRVEKGRRVTSTVSPAMARRLEAALRDHRQLKALLRRWERESARIIKAESS